MQVMIFRLDGLVPLGHSIIQVPLFVPSVILAPSLPTGTGQPSGDVRDVVVEAELEVEVIMEVVLDVVVMQTSCGLTVSSETEAVEPGCWPYCSPCCWAGCWPCW